MSSSVIGALRVNLGLDSAQFNSGLKSAQSGMARLGKQIAAAMAGVAASAGIAGAAIQSAAGRATEMKRFADVAGAGYEEFQRVAQAAKAVAIESDKLADIYKDVNDKVGDFLQTGGGPMADFFENIAPQVGLTAREFAKLSGPDALQAYYNALEKAGLSQAEMTFYMEAIASDATMLIPLLRKNGAEFSRLGDQAEALGLVMSEKTAAGAKRFQENIRVLGQSMQGLWNRVLGRVIGGMEALSARLVEAASSGGGLRSAVDAISWAMNALARGVMVVFDNLGTLYDLLKVFAAAKIATGTLAAAGAFISLAKTVRVAGLAMVAFTTVTRAKITALALAAAAIAKLTGTYDDMAAWLKKTSDSILEGLPESMRTGLESLSDKIKSFGDEITAVDDDVVDAMSTFYRVGDSAAASFGNAGDAAKTTGDRLKGMQADAARVFEATRTPMERFQARIAQLGDLLAAGKITQETYNRAVVEAQDAFSRAEEAGKKTGNVMTSISDTISSSFASAFQGLIDGSRKVGDVLNGLLAQFASMAVNSVFQALVKGALGGGSVLGGGGGIAGLAGSTFAGWYATGGSVPAGKWGIAGEAGPEIVTGPAHVWTANDMASMAGRGGGQSVVVNQTFQISGAVSSDEITAAIRQQAAATKAEIEGSFARTFERNRKAGTV